MNKSLIMDILTLVKEFLFGVRREPVDTISTGFRSSYPDNQPTYEEWCKQFNVSMLYDRKILHL
jgi:hypothetical protein